MRIVNTFISDGGELPAYTQISLAQARKTNPDVTIDFICKDDQSFFKDIGVNWIPQDSLKDGTTLKEFNNLCWFKRHGTPNTTHPSPELFWHRTCERIYYLSEYVDKNRLYDVFHFENDVLLYHDLDGVPQANRISLTPMSVDQVTFAFVHVPMPALIVYLCKFLNEALAIGEEGLIQRFGFDHVSEMSLLHIANKCEMFEAFKTVPEIGEKDFVFDPGSYGQYLGGTNNGHESGFTDPKHMIGALLRNNKIGAEFTDKPYAIGSDGIKHPIFNLHVHSKNLEGFVNV